jgi:uncharacterized protein
VIEPLLGRRVSLRVRSLAADGAWLEVDRAELRLPLGEVPTGVRAGDLVEVFVYLDSDDRPVATTAETKLALGEVRFLEVTAVTPIGAFVDWGLGKELLVPFAQQSKELHPGELQPIGLYLDKSVRLAGTMFVGDMLGAPREVALDDWLAGEAWRNDPDIGLFAILERRFVGLVPASEPHRLRRGDEARFRVAHVLPDGKLVLSLRQHAHREVESDAATILAVLARPGAPEVGDGSSPDTIRAVFGLSKKAFKRAVGRLLKAGTVTLDDRGTVKLAAKSH